MSPPTCDHEANALKYFSGQLSGNELARVETHIAGCSKCCQTLAELAKVMTAEVSEEEKAFLSATFEESAKEARELVKKTLKESKASNASNVASLTKQNNSSKGFFLFNSKATQLAIASSIVILLLVGAIALYQSNSTSTEDTRISQARDSIKEINRAGRPTKLRIAGFDYAPENRTRGSESEEPKRILEAYRGFLKSLVQKDPRPSNRQLLAQILLLDGDYDGATTQLSEAAKIDSTNPSILNDLAVVQAAQNDYEVALQTINKALAINPNYLAAIFNRALIYYELKQYNEARSDLEKYLQLDPSSPWANEAKQQLNSIKQ